MSPILLIVLAALWAAVLIPATVNSRTHAHDDRTISGFSTAMRTLSRRSTMATTDRRTILVPTSAVTDERRRAVRSRVARRRVVFARLVLLAAVSAVLAIVLRGAFVWVHLGLDLTVAGAVVWLRRAVLRDAERARAERRARLAEREAAEHAEYLARRRAAAEPPRRGPVVVYDDVPRRRVVGG